MERRLLVLSAIALSCMGASLARAAPLTFVSDLISTSAPGARATHTIQFTLAQAVPPSGSIVITPEDAFTLPGAFDYTDLSLEVNSATTSLASVASATDDGVSIVSGASSMVTITLNSTSGLSAGDTIRITLASTTFSSLNPINPAVARSYRIRLQTKDASGASIDTGTAMVAIVEQVAVTAGVFQRAPRISNGLPSGTVAANNSTIELSLDTDELATCRFATSSNISYSAMTGSFLPNVSESFYVDLTGFQNNTTYTYYVRCTSTQGLADTSDYVISFMLAPTPISDTSIVEPSTGGHGGVGNYPGGSPVLYLSSVTFTGVSPPGTVTMLSDGASNVSTIAGVGGSFNAEISGLERGVYTFSMFVTDESGIKSAPFSATLDVQQGSANSISGIAIPPTVALDSDSINVGDSAGVSGVSIPGSSVEIDASVLSAAGVPGAPQVFYASSTDSGAWQLTIPSADLARGLYAVKARSIVSSSLSSDFGSTLTLGVGEAPAACANTTGDLNGDDKVNLVDFSILLTGWGKSGPGDLNCDGTVNLADFSIMLYNWTG